MYLSYIHYTVHQFLIFFFSLEGHRVRKQSLKSVGFFFLNVALFPSSSPPWMSLSLTFTYYNRVLNLFRGFPFFAYRWPLTEQQYDSSTMCSWSYTFLLFIYFLHFSFKKDAWNRHITYPVVIYIYIRERERERERGIYRGIYIWSLNDTYIQTKITSKWL